MQSIVAAVAQRLTERGIQVVIICGGAINSGTLAVRSQKHASYCQKVVFEL